MDKRAKGRKKSTCEEEEALQRIFQKDMDVEKGMTKYLCKLLWIILVN